MPKPEGYRKALRIMKLAEKFNLPIITFIDTPGAYPGIDAESRNQSQAIAENLYVMSNLKVPIISVIIGEGGSGGALAIGVCDKLGMLQNSIYSVISPEGCASILWKDASKANIAAEALSITSDKLLGHNLIDRIIVYIPNSGYNGVVDFIDVGLIDHRWYIFNIADSAVTIGITLYLAYSIFFEDKSIINDAR